MAYFKSSFPPPPAPAAPLDTIRRVSFRHPAYPEPAPDLLCLPAADGDGQDGIDYDTAFVACCIVTGNTWHDGWLARKNSQGEFQRVDKPSDGILRGDTYYFRLGQNPVEYKYPVLPSFDHWRFPHSDVPAPWSSLRIPSAGLSVNLKQKTAALSRDGTCRISGYLDAVEVAHIVPRASGYWFEYNSMAKYTRLSDVPQQVDDDRNLITLRRDLHYLFDQCRFTFVVKQPREGDSLQVVTYVLCAQGSTELISLYHNRLPQPLSGISQSSCLHGLHGLSSTPKHSPSSRACKATRSSSMIFQHFSTLPKISKRARSAMHLFYFRLTPRVGTQAPVSGPMTRYLKVTLTLRWDGPPTMMCRPESKTTHPAEDTVDGVWSGTQARNSHRG